MAGKTKLIIGLVHNKFVHLPIRVVTSKKNYVDPEGSLWRDCLDATSQPILMVNDKEAFLKNSQALRKGKK
jgi:6-phosphofructokinase 1